MAIPLNHVTFAGNLTRDPEARDVGDKLVVHFTLANNRRYKTADGEARDEVTFLDVEAWGRSGELAQQYLLKGHGAVVTGRLKQEQWTDKDGNKRSRIKLVAEQVHFLSRPAGDRNEDRPEDRSSDPSPNNDAGPVSRPRAAHRPSSPRGPITDEAPF